MTNLYAQASRDRGEPIITHRVDCVRVTQLHFSLFNVPLQISRSVSHSREARRSRFDAKAIRQPLVPMKRDQAGFGYDGGTLCFVQRHLHNSTCSKTLPKIPPACITDTRVLVISQGGRTVGSLTTQLGIKGFGSHDPPGQTWDIRFLYAEYLPVDLLPLPQTETAVVEHLHKRRRRCSKRRASDLRPRQTLRDNLPLGT